MVAAPETGDIRSQWERDMPGQVGTVFHRLWQDTAWMFATWEVFKELFAQGQERAALLTWAGARLFRLIGRLLTQEIFLALSRLTDPPYGAGRPNASLKRLAEAISEAGDEDLAAEIKAEVAKIQGSCTAIRERRNRVVAHSDLATALNPDKELMAGATVAKVEKVMREVREVLNRVEGRYRQSETAYDARLVSVEAEKLITILSRARKAREG